MALFISISGKIKSMSTLFSDTHPKMEALLIELWRKASPTRKMQMLAQLNQSARLLALAGLRSQYPHASEAELRRRLTGLLSEKKLHVRSMESCLMQNEPIEVTIKVTHVLESPGISYLIRGGGVLRGRRRPASFFDTRG